MTVLNVLRADGSIHQVDYDGRDFYFVNIIEAMSGTGRSRKLKVFKFNFSHDDSMGQPVTNDSSIFSKLYSDVTSTVDVETGSTVITHTYNVVVQEPHNELFSKLIDMHEESAMYASLLHYEMSRLKLQLSKETALRKHVEDKLEGVESSLGKMSAFAVFSAMFSAVMVVYLIFN